MPDGRDWNGILNDTSDIGDGLIDLENVTLFTSNMLNRRPGFDAGITCTSKVVTMEEVGSYIVTAENDGGIRTYQQNTGSATTLQTGYTVSPQPVMTSAYGRVYITNGSQSVKVVSAGNTIRDAGIVAPSVTPTVGASGALSSAGVHYCRYRYYDSANNRLSNPSVAVAITTTATSGISVTPTASADSTVTNILIEITAADSNTFYVWAQAANTGAATVFATTDDILTLKTPSSINGDFGHAQPPTYSLIAENRQRTWMMNPTTGLLAWSQAGFPESFDTTSNARIITLASGDSATAIFGFFSDLYVVGQRSMQRFVYSTDPAGSMVLPVLGGMGAYNAQCVCKTSTGEVFGWGRDGMWRLNSMQPVKISKRISDFITQYCDSGQITNRWVRYDPIQQCVRFFFCLQGETLPRGAFVFWVAPVNPQADWSLDKFRQPMVAGCYNSSYADRQRLAIADSNNYIWRMGTALNDGGAGSALSVTSATTTVINGTNTAVVGMMAYRPKTGEEKLITAVTSGSITTTAFAIAPAAGELIYCGSIRMRWTTQWYTGNTAMNKKRPSYLKLIVHPQTATSGTFIVRYYLDFATSPSAVTSFSNDTWTQGVSIGNGTDITVDAGIAAIDGYIAIPCFSDFQRAIRAEIISDYPATALRFYDFGWAFTNRTEQVPVVGE
jgi:hypothetical protein